MNIDDQLTDRIATLARLRFDGEEKAHIRQDMERMLEFIGKLEEIDTADTEPLIHVGMHVHRLREDRVGNQLTADAALRNAPDHDSDYFRVPKVLEK